MAAEECLVGAAPDYKGRIGSINSTLFTYDYIGSRVLQRSHYVTGGNDIDVDYAYDNLGRVTDIVSSDGTIDFDYTYAAGENNIADIAFNHRTSTPSNDFVYDDLDRLYSVEYLDDTTDTEAFTMDLLGNRTNVNLRDNSTETYAVDDTTNRYATIGTDNIYYDDAGNLLARADSTDSNGYIYYYDYENRLAKITRWNEPTETTIVTYTYDALGRRIKMVDAITPANSRYYYFSDNWQVLEEYSVETTPAIEAYYVWGGYIDELVFIFNADNSLFAHVLHDHLFSPVALVSPIGTVLERYEYNAYGKVSVYVDTDSDGVWFDDPQDTTHTYSQIGNPYLFTGRRQDTLDAGDYNIYYYRNRYYDADMGRFLQKDPLGVVPDGLQMNPFAILRQYRDGANIYQYVSSSPIIGMDPIGLRITEIPTFPTPREGEVCCKIKETHVSYTLGEFSITTTCRQENRNNPQGNSAVSACKCHYEKNRNITVYDAHYGKCCSCKIYRKAYLDKMFGISFEGHVTIMVRCEQGRGDWEASVGMPGGRDDWGDAIGIGRPVDVSVGSIGTGNTTKEYLGSISCDAADKWKQKFGKMQWRYQWPTHSCETFTEKYGPAMARSCP